jgi:magnesium transporter
MAELEVLSNAFLVAHPAEAARVLDRLTPAEAAALFDRVPARVSGPVLAAMLPHAAARCVTALEPGRGALLLSALGPLGAASTLRHVAEPARTRLLGALPTAVALACRALLGYPEDAVGAWVDTDVIALPPGCRADEALAALRAAPAHTSTTLFVVGVDHRLLGLVAPTTLLRCEARSRLDMLMVQPQATLRAVMPLASAAAHPMWSECDEAAVVARGDRLVGVLRRATLQKVLHSRPAPPAPEPQSLPAALAGGYWEAVAGLAEYAVTLLAPGRGGTR